MRKIIHVDLDCFYAAVEIRDDLGLQGQPVAVGGSPQRRGVLTTCNYEARKFGLHSAMPTIRALQLCPDLVLLPVAMDKYRQASQGIHTIFQRYTDTIEPVSLDEAYLDVSDSNECQGSATLLAQKIRGDILQATQLTASAGIAPNKFLAKVASDWNKPNGQFTITPKHIANFIKALPVQKIPGVGKVTAQKLNDKGIHTCEQLQQLSRIELIDAFGKWGERLHDYCRGVDDRPVESHRIRKSVSVENTYPQDVTTFAECETHLTKLYEQLTRRLEKHTDRTIHKQFIKIKWTDFTRTTKECISSELTLPIFMRLFASVYQNNTQPIRLLGMGVRFDEIEKSNIDGKVQQSLWKENNYDY